MKILRWALVGLIALYGLAELFAAGSTAAAKLGLFHEPRIVLLASGAGWPQLLMWLSVSLFCFVSAVLLARGNRRATPTFGFAILVTVSNLGMFERSPVYAKVFDASERMIDWYGVGVLFVILGLMVLVLRRDRVAVAAA